MEPDITFLKNLKVFHICKICGVKIKTFWNDEDKIFDGHYIALQSELSELFGVYQPIPTEILCGECFVFKKHI